MNQLNIDRYPFELPGLNLEGQYTFNPKKITGSVSGNFEDATIADKTVKIKRGNLIFQLSTENLNLSLSGKTAESEVLFKDVYCNTS